MTETTEPTTPPAVTPPAPVAAKETDKYEKIRDCKGAKLSVMDFALALVNEKAVIGQVLEARQADGRVTLAVLRDRGWPAMSPEATFQHYPAKRLLRLDAENGVLLLARELAAQDEPKVEKK